MAFMSLNDWAAYIGITRQHAYYLRTEGRITGLTEVRPRMWLIDTDKAKILPPANKPRRFDGPLIGRSKPMRGEPGFKERK